MSAFLVEREVISTLAQEIVTGIQILPEDREPFKARSPLLQGEARDLAQALWEMNWRAVHSRYADRYVEDNAFTFSPQSPQSALWVWRQVHCLHYQCTEGEVREEPLYRALERYMFELADQLVYSMPGARFAPWGRMKQ